MADAHERAMDELLAVSRQSAADAAAAAPL
jgi:hypothetical protein